MTVKEDLSLTGLNFGVLRRKLLRKWRFYACVAVLQCYAAFPIHSTAPIDQIRELLPPPESAPLWGGMSNLTFVVPQHSVWLYVPPLVSLMKDPAVNETIYETIENYGTCEVGWPGWLAYVVGIAFGMNYTQTAT